MGMEDPHPRMKLLVTIGLLLQLSCSSGRGQEAAQSPGTDPRPVQAAPAPPEAEPGAYRLDFEIDFEHGCSLSNESRGADGYLSLDIGADGKAALTLDLDEGSVMGPSFGEFQKGNQSFSYQHSETHDVWTGTAGTEGQGIRVAFEKLAHSFDEAWEYDKTELPPPTESASQLVLECTSSTIDVYGQVPRGKYFWDTEGEIPSPSPVLLCKPSEEILGWFHQMVLVDGVIPLGPGRGIAMLSSRIYYSENRVIRLGASSGS